MNLVEKILAAHAGKKEVSPGDLLNMKVDLVAANDITAPLAILEFRKLGVKKVFDPKKVVLIPDHFVPNKDIESAEQTKFMREFAHEQGVVYFEVGQMGIEHVIIPDLGMVLPGQVVVGADSHTCTYGALGALATGMGSTDIACAMATGDTWMKAPQSIKVVYHGQRRKWVGGKDFILNLIGDLGVDGANYAALEFHGEAMAGLPMDGRLTMSNMAIECGAKAGIFPVDDTTREYLRTRTRRRYTAVAPDPDAAYAQVREYDASKLEPQVAFPFLPSNARPVSQAGNVVLDQVVIGSCTNGRISDLREAAGIIKGRKVNKGLRLIVIPGSQQVYLTALQEGLIETFIRSGAAVSTPTCGPCLGGYMGVLAAGERCLSTTNRNFVGRMGSTKSEVYLAGPAVAAASAILGRIASPEEVLS